MVQAEASISREINVNMTFPVVCIGASAGGLEAFKKLLNKLSPKTGMAFVLIQHLSPDYESILDELLSRETNIPVITAKNNLPLEPDHIYVIPPNKDMGISKMKLTLSSPHKLRGCQMPIDFFLKKLSKDQGNNGIGVILSGTASDGVNGIRELKAAGGITFAQDKISAQHSGMPLNAVASGCIDFILPPEQIAEELNRISQHPYIQDIQNNNILTFPAEKEDVYKKIFYGLKRHTGVDFTYYKLTTIARRINHRIVLLKLDSIEDYVTYLHKNPDEFKSLYDNILINVTDFFRDPVQIEALKTKVFPAILKNKKANQAIRIWVPGCATGEEPYSIAIALMEFLGDTRCETNIQIFGTDISDKSIDQARSGIYTESSMSNISGSRLKRFFVKEENGYRIKNSIREICVFAKHDITKDPPFSNLDFISCKNLMIYMGTVLQKKVIPLFHYALQSIGFLMLGPSESINSYSSLFEQIDKKNKIYSKKLTNKPLRYEFPIHLHGIPIKENFVKQKQYSAGFNVKKEADDLLLKKYVLPSVLINSDMEIIQFFGDTSIYLQHSAGKATLNIMKLINEELFVTVRTSINKIQKEKKSIINEGICLRHDKQMLCINIEFNPIIIPETEEQCVLIVFRAENNILNKEKSGVVRQKNIAISESDKDKEILRLSQEIEKMKEYLQAVTEDSEATNEELRASNEELMSSNEELQSTNEELETAKEELQSTNEEIATINEELSNRNIALDRTNNDLVNLLSSINIPILMLDNDLCIRRFNSMAGELFNLIPSDIDRKFTNIKPNIDIPDFESFIKSVRKTLTVKEREVKDHTGKWYSIRIRPYITVDNKIDGVVITLLDISELKRNMENLQQFLSYTENIVNTIREPLLVLDNELRIISANKSFYEFFCLEPKDTENKLIYKLSHGQWDIPPLRKLLEEVLPSNKKFDNFDVNIDLANIGSKKLLLNARQIMGSESGIQKILLVIEDVTERYKTAEKLAEHAKSLEMVNQELDCFVHTVSHDLRSPLITIQSYSKLALEELSGCNEKNMTSYLERIHKASIKMSNMFDDLLKLSKISRLLNPFEDVRIAELIHSVQECLEFEIKDSNVDFRIQDNLPVICCDKIKMFEVFQNLLQNSIKFSSKIEDKQPVIEIGYADKKEYHEFYVKDNGIGLEMNYAKKIFDVFQQLESKKSFSGTGVGLTIVNRIIQEHCGKIWVESEVGKGATFYFTISKNLKSNAVYTPAQN